MKYHDTNALRYLETMLNLPQVAYDTHWDTEQAKPERAEEFVKFLMERHIPDGSEEKYSLMALVMASLNGLYLVDQQKASALLDSIKIEFHIDRYLLMDILVYWCALAELDVVRAYPITPHVREILRGILNEDSW